jgi:predicted TIM-barrel enzyme
MIRVARGTELFTMVYVFTEEEAVAMAQAGVDCIVAHVGGTTGGLVGFEAAPLEEAAQRVRTIVTAAREARADVLCLAHGGPFATPEDTRYLYEHTDAVGFVGASSVERIPIEKAVMGAVRDFKAIPLRARS